MRGPCVVQESNQKLAFFPSLRSHVVNFFATCLRAMMLFQIQEELLCTSTAHKFVLLSLCSKFQATHKESVPTRRRHNSLSCIVLFQETKSRSPSPPSFLGKQISCHDTFAHDFISILPAHKNLVHRLCISFRHPFGSVNADNQKLTKL